MCFQLLKKNSTIKLNLVDKMKRITYFCVILHVERKKITNSRRFYPSFILVKYKMETKMATTFGDERGSSCATPDRVYLIL